MKKVKNTISFTPIWDEMNWKHSILLIFEMRF